MKKKTIPVMLTEIEQEQLKAIAKLELRSAKAQAEFVVREYIQRNLCRTKVETK